MRKLLTIFGVTLCCMTQFSHASEQPDASVERGIASCNQGNYYLALETLQAAYAQHKSGPQRVKAAGGLGLTYLRMRRPVEAEGFLREAYQTAEDPIERARYGIDLANLQAGRGQTAEARRLYDEALKLAPGDVPIAVSVGLNLTHLGVKSEQLAQLRKLFALLPGVKQAKDRARFAINLGVQAKATGPGGLELAYQSFEFARLLAGQAKEARLSTEALDQLAQLYEDRNRNDDALRLTELGVMAAQSTESRDLLINLEWRHGRLLRKQGKLDSAIAAYQRAVDHIEAIRQDIPVEYQDGRSSFRDTLEPVYLGLADLLLQRAASLGGKEQSAQLRRARNTVELIKQTELEDFLGDRCSIETTRNLAKDDAKDDANEAPIAARTAVLYPIILPDRLELLVETSAGLERKTVAIGSAELRHNVTSFAAALRAHQSYQILARKLYDALLLPTTEIFEREKIDTVVVVPDGVLRLLPFGALHDGRNFAIQKYAIAVVPGLTMTNTQGGRDAGRDFKTLLAGMSEPGSVVGKLPDDMVAQLLFNYKPSAAEPENTPSRAQFARGPQAQDRTGATSADSTGGKLAEPATTESGAEKQDHKLKQVLALSGVREEIDNLGKLAPGQTLLNQNFSLKAFGDQIRSGDYRVIHIASHGVFGGSADTTFIMADDGLITIDKLQGFLRSSVQRNHPIELLILSACETAEGDDRAPLGLSGAALKARVKSVLGSLWPVSDDAAKMLMGEFYKDMSETGVTKAKALQSAQLRLIDDKSMQHPFFWAPFVLIGSWL